MATFIADPTVPRAAPATTVPARMDPTPLGVTFPRVLRAEWIKFRSLRANWLTLLAAALLMLVVGAIAATFLSDTIAGGDGFADTTDPTTTSLSGMMLAQIVLGIAGVLVITGEYASGMLRATFAAVPRRLPVLGAKALVVAGVSLVTMVPTMLASFFLGQSIIGGELNAAIGDAGVLRAVLGSAAYLTAIALLGLGLGTILRQAAGAIGVLFALFLIVPPLLELALPASFDPALRYLPSTAGQSFTTVGGSAGLLAPVAGMLVVGAWVAAVLGVAAVLFRRRDA